MRVVPKKFCLKNRLRADFLNPAGLNARRIPKGSNVTPLSVVCPPLSYSCTQRTGKPTARPLLPSGYTLELPKSRSDPLSLDAEEGELLQAQPFLLTLIRPPDQLVRQPEAG